MAVAAVVVAVPDFGTVAIDLEFFLIMRGIRMVLMHRTVVVHVGSVVAMGVVVRAGDGEQGCEGDWE